PARAWRSLSSLPMAIAETAYRIADAADGDLLGHALEIFIVPAASDLAGTDAGDALPLLRALAASQQGIATGMNAVPYRNCPGMTAVVGVVRAFLRQTLGNDRHFYRHLSHDGLRSTCTLRHSRRSRNCRPAGA